MTAKNKLNNKARYWSGRAKETVGRVTGNRRTQYEGKVDQVKLDLRFIGLACARTNVAGFRLPAGG